MKNTALSHPSSAQIPTIGSLPRHYSPKFARLMQEIRQANQDLANAIQDQIATTQAAERKVRSLLAQYRIATRRVPVLDFYGEQM